MSLLKLNIFLFQASHGPRRYVLIPYAYYSYSQSPSMDMSFCSAIDNDAYTCR